MKHIVCLKKTYRQSKHGLSNEKWSSILILLNKLSKLSFQSEKDKPIRLHLSFNSVPVARKPVSEHLGSYLDEKLSFSKHIKENIAKAMNGISLLKFLSKYVSKDILNMSYKMYVRSHLDYGDVIYHNRRANLMNLLEQVQYKAALGVSGCWQGTSREKIYSELDLESLSD